MLERLQSLSPWLSATIGVCILLLAALVADIVLHRTIVPLTRYLARRSPVQWDDALGRHRVFRKISHAVPALIVERGILLVPHLPEALVGITQNVALAYITLTLTLALTSALTAGNEVYETRPISRDRPLKGIVQVVQIIVWIIGTVLIVSALADKSPLILLSGVGAMTAVLLLVFKDTILGLVASLQLSANDMVRVGDWIEMPSYGADGDVVEVALHTVKVQNWDKTITTIPTYKLIAESFKNWRGMAESGGRRIKRALNLDQRSIRFLTADDIDYLERFALLTEHIESKRSELEQAAASLGEQAHDSVNRRRLTNVGVFRAYVKNYLASHPQLNHEMTTLVRQLEPGPAGLPIEVYCFTATTDWLAYEDVQSDIFDHLLAILPEFGLRLYQQPSGSDLERIGRAADA